jgi:hypothetical protein
MVDALERIHAALAHGAIVVDTQPVSARPPIVGEHGSLGTLDMREWAETIAAVDERIMETIAAGLFSVAADRHIVVTDVYDDRADLVDVTSEWAGTSISPALGRRAKSARGPVQLHQDVRVRVLARL